MFWQNQNLIKTLYTQCVNPICERFEITQMEFNIIMMLELHPEYDTAADIVNYRKLTKSHVSMSLKRLEKIGMVEKKFKKDNRKTIHLKLTDKAKEITQLGVKAQKEYKDMLFTGFSDEEKQQFAKLFVRITDNINEYVNSVSTED